ncbi:MAG UNVERIFIED_CONTAM: sulfatase-like hydrolase/transferase [Planctomycetaceae bacterium]|jgi:hypothetical protein
MRFIIAVLLVLPAPAALASADDLAKQENAASAEPQQVTISCEQNTLCGGSSAGGSSGRARPNILFLLTDDQRWDAVGVAGHPSLKTPHIDRLANEGVHFRNAFCTTSLCSPSRASILSGLYAARSRCGE